MSLQKGELHPILPSTNRKGSGFEVESLRAMEEGNQKTTAMSIQVRQHHGTSR